MRIEQPWLVLDNPRPRQPKEDNIVSGIHQHNLISSLGQWCQDSRVGTSLFHPLNAMPSQYFGHLSEGMGSAQHGSQCAFEVYGGYCFKYYWSLDTAGGHAGRLNNWASGSCWMHKWLAQSSLQQEADLAYPTTTPLCSSSCIFCDLPSMQGAPVENWGAPEPGDVPKGTAYIWKYQCSIMYQWCANDVQSNLYCQARYRVERGGFVQHLLIEMIRCWSCPVHTSVVDLSTFLFAG